MRYQNKDTVLHKINPILKIVYGVIVSILIVLLKTPFHLVILSLVVFSIFCLTKINFNTLKPLFFVIAFIVITTSVSQALFYFFEPKTVLLTIIPKEFPVIGWLTKGIYVYREGIIYGSIQSLRIISVIFMALTIVMTTHPSDMIFALNKMRLPKELSFTLSLSIRFLPQILDETKRVLLAIKLRGLRTKGIINSIKTLRFILLPLVINSLRRARQIALAAEVRGFSAGNLRTKSQFNTLELITISFFIVFMYVSILPFKMGLSRVPFLSAFFFSIPFTCVLFMGIRLIPKFGTPTLLICGYTLFNQIMSRGINPIWWPYAIIGSLVLEVYFFLTKNYLKTLTCALFSGALRGLVVYLYFYLIASPLIWHKFYASWYITIQTIQGILGSSLGGLLGYKISKIVERTYRYSSL